MFLYYTVVALILVLAGPVMLFKRKARFGLRQKLGRVPSRIVKQSKASKVPSIWFHTVSVGEFNAVYPLMLRFKNERPEVRIFVSTTTGTGQALAQEKVGPWATVFYFPFDLPWAINRWLDVVSPDLVAIAETELWPGFTHECQRRGIKLCIVNGRISPRSFARYRLLKFLFGPVIHRFEGIAAQSDQESLRYRELSARLPAVRTCGNMKFDGLTPCSPCQRDTLRQQLALSESMQVIVAGSTHDGEETALLQALRELPTNTRLIIAPRHPERFDKVCQPIQAAGLNPVRYTTNGSFSEKNDVYVLDTIGQLMNFYSLASVAFVGGTLAPIGGHSLIEPYAYGTPVVCGPHLSKTKDIADRLKDRNALIVAKDAQELTKQLKRLISSPSDRQRLGSLGKQYVTESQGAVERTFAMMEELLPSSQGSDLRVPAGSHQ